MLLRQASSSPGSPMAFRLYVVPIVTTGNLREPKYLTTADPEMAGGWWAGKDYGMEPWMLVGANLSAQDDTLLAGRADVLALPFDLTPTLTAGQVTTVQTKLEAANIPAGWITTAFTWVQVVQTVVHVFEFLQRYCWLRGVATQTFPASIFTTGITLNSTFGSLPAGVRATLSATAVSFGLDTSGIVANTPIRAMLKGVADQLAASPVIFNGIVITDQIVANPVPGGGV